MRTPQTLWKNIFHLGLNLIFIVALQLIVGCSSGANPATTPATGTTVVGGTITPIPTLANGSLFDSTLSTDTAPAGGTTASPLAAPAQVCLNSDQALLGYPSSQYPFAYSSSSGSSAFTPSGSSSSYPYSSSTYPYTSTSSNVAPACVNGADPNQFFNAGLSGFSSMESCYQLVASNAPSPYDQNQSDIDYAFLTGQLAMVRCFRNILRQQMGQFNWGPDVQQGFQGNDGAFYLMLTLLAHPIGH